MRLCGSYCKHKHIPETGKRKKKKDAFCCLYSFYRMSRECYDGQLNNTYPLLIMAGIHAAVGNNMMKINSKHAATNMRIKNKMD